MNLRPWFSFEKVVAHMDIDRWNVATAAAERLPAFLLAALVTAALFAAINAGFTPDRADMAGWEWQHSAGDPPAGA
jgi:hypothetical protein